MNQNVKVIILLNSLCLGGGINHYPYDHTYHKAVLSLGTGERSNFSLGSGGVFFQLGDERRLPGNSEESGPSCFLENGELSVNIVFELT